ncbi:NAC domain-containing protein 104-like [Silene latifolia]|uniref:NAC domain-containing protein 104-like n=1 Tax=Silene latifolia TaxID=37657 RepID=UPI003D7827EC
MAEETIMENEENILSVSQLPPGFRFDPTDEELVLHFLYSHFNKPASFSSLPVSHYLNLIPVLEDFYHCNYYHPSQLNGKAFESYGKWYFYTRMTENRVTQNGYWKETDMDQPIFATCMPNNKPVGVKKCMVYYEGMFPSGVNTGWFIEEYHLCCCAPTFLHLHYCIATKEERHTMMSKNGFYVERNKFVMILNN